MFRRTSSPFSLLIFFLVLLSASLASANSVELLNFAGLKNMQQVGGFYDGEGNIPNFGVTFSSNFYGLLPFSRGGSGNFFSPPLGTPAIFIQGTFGSPATGTMNVTNGFSSGINFYYTAAFQETVTVWSGANGTGSVLATINLAANDGNCAGGSYCNWTNVGASFSGTAQSVTFSGPADALGVADITIGKNTTAIPEPSSFYLLGTGIAGFFARGIRRLLKS